MSAELVRKLGIRPGVRLFFRAECADLMAAVAPYIPSRVTIVRTPTRDDRVDTVLLRPRNEELRSLFTDAKEWIVPNGAVWVVVKKKAYRGEDDVSFEAAQAAALPAGLVDNKECSVSGTEYATRYVLRRELRPKA